MFAYSYNEDLQMKFLQSIKNIILLYVVALSVVYFFVRYILDLADLRYRQWIVMTFVLLLTFGIISGIFQLLLKIRFKWVKVISTGLATCIVIAMLPYGVLFFALAFGRQHVVHKDGHKLLAHVAGTLQDTWVYYYDYKNPFVHGKRLRLYEYYGSGSFDPFSSRDRGNREVKQYHWYDD